VTASGKTTGCVFCDAQHGEQATLIVFRGATCYVILNLYPYNNGHLMVVPNRHIASLAAATTEELSELIELTRRAELALGEAYSPHGLNMGINLGKPAGAGVLVGSRGSPLVSAAAPGTVSAAFPRASSFPRARS